MEFKGAHSQESMKEILNMLADYMNNEDQGAFCSNLHLKFESCDFSKSNYECSFETKSEFGNPGGVLHGGIIASMFDTAMGCLAVCYSGRMTPTISLEVSYLRAMPLDDRMRVKAKLTMNGRSLCHVTAEAWAESSPETIVATAAGVYHIS